MTQYRKFVPITALFVSYALTFASGSALAAAAGGSTLPQAESPDKHFDPQGKPPSEHTLKIIREARKTFPFEDTRDYDEASKGFIAPLNDMVIPADAGGTAWDIARYEWLNEGRDFDSVHPSLQRLSLPKTPSMISSPLYIIEK
jgi:alkyl sulfatase BDS1-like metallo-beta-lactamase superfamily hydrolase